MKSKILLLAILLLGFTCIFSQTLPKGMNYQAVARNLKGEIMPNETIALKINLVSNKDGIHAEHYSETHTITTNALGLFSLTVGEGSIEKGSFDAIPWSTENIWMEVAIKDRTQSNFSIISNSKLLAVPYAMHAGTANAIVGDKTQINEQSQGKLSSLLPSPGVVSTTWSVFGNAKTDASGNIYRLNSLGTTDYVDLFLITDNVERFRITAAGDIITKLNFEVGKSVVLNSVGGTTTIKGPLTITSATILNSTLVVNKSTTLNDSLIVANMKPTILTGKLRVDKATTLNDSLTVTGMKPTYLTGTLTVDKATKLNNTLTVDKSTTLNDSLTVTGMKPTYLTGTLSVDKATKLNNTLTVDKSTTLNDSLTVTGVKPTYLSGKLTVDKATKLNDSLTVTGMKPTYLTGTLTVDKATKLNDSLTVTGMKPTYLTGTLIVEKATKLNNTLIVDKSTNLNDSLTVNNMKPTRLTGTLTVDKELYLSKPAAFSGSLTVSDTFRVLSMAPTILTGKLRVDKSTTLNDSLTVTGMKPTYLTGTLTVDKATKLNNTLTVDKSTTLNDSLSVTGMKPTYLTGSLTVDKRTRLNDSLIVNGTTIFNKGFIDSANVPDGQYLATFYNTNNGNGDGIKIRLGRPKASYTLPSSKDTLTSTQLDQIKNLLNCSTSVSDKGTGLANIILEGALTDLKYIGGLAVGVGNMLIGKINDGIGLPDTISNLINNGLGLPIDITTPVNNAFSLPWDITGTINNKLGLPQKIGPYSIPQIDFPKLAVAGFIVDVPVIPTFTLPGFTVVEKFKLVDKIDLIPELTVVPAITANLTIPKIPNFSIPKIPDLIIPRIPNIDLTSIGVTEIDPTDISFWGVPNLCLTDVTTSPLNHDNVFIRFTDKDDLKLGSIKAVSVADWAVDFLNPVYLYGLREALTSCVADKKHALYHFKLEVKKALLAYAKIGVEYSSGNGDYAEWLIRDKAEEAINAGDIVGVIGGKISKDLTNAEQVMAVSHKPIILGNLPPDGKVAYGNNVAFMGQVPVKVMGPVATGDYIIGNAVTPGYGIAKKQADMTVIDFKYAVGRAWEENATHGPIMVNTVIGVHNGDYIKILKKYEEKFEKTESRLHLLEQKVEVLLDKSSH